ncbi:MAG TPA: M12 family metallo-peptidase [Thermoanaerobaculia bacterium]|nr:M12 family metallo-peptidase [Thermoanaerobaculia bacterium]
MHKRFVLSLARIVFFPALCLVFSSPLTAGPGPVSAFDAMKARPVEVASKARASAPGALFRIVGLRGAEGEPLTLDLETAPLFTANFHLYIDGQDRGKDAVARLTLLRGTVEEWPRSSVALTVNSATGAWSGFLADGDRFYEVTIPAGAADASQGSIAKSAVVSRTAFEPLAKNSHLSDALAPPAAFGEKAGSLQTKIVPAPGADYQATLALDSDYEFFQLFGDADAAAEYLAKIFGNVSELYFRQLGVSLAISSISLYTTPDDPWNAPNPHSGATADVLCEFSSFWQSFRPVKNYPRNAAMFFTGKASNDIGGQAWLFGLCNYAAKPSSCPYGGYGIVVAIRRLALDTNTTAHELGHIFGSIHTHCYEPPIDQCFGGEDGCYSGPESVPPGGGSVMSYCSPSNFSMGEAGKYGLDSERVEAAIRDLVDAVGATCMVRTSDPFELAATPATGKATLSWIDPFSTESNWLVEQLQSNGKFKQVKSLPANATGVTITGLRHGSTYSFRVRAKIKKDFSVYSDVVTVKP